jgi:hypothetical protein
LEVGINLAHEERKSATKELEAQINTLRELSDDQEGLIEALRSTVQELRTGETLTKSLENAAEALDMILLNTPTPPAPKPKPKYQAVGAAHFKLIWNEFKQNPSKFRLCTSPLQQR